MGTGNRKGEMSMRKRKRILSLVLALVMLLCLNVPAPVFAEESGYGYSVLSSQEMYNWLSMQRGSAIRPQNLWQAEHCINDFYPAEWVLGESKESVFYQIVGLTDSLVSGKTSDLEKARAIYDWVSQNIAYDYVAYEYRVSGAAIYDEDEEKDMRADQAVDAFYTFYNRRGVCDGYANLTWLMLTIAEVPGAFISGTDHQMVCCMDGTRHMLVGGGSCSMRHGANGISTAGFMTGVTVQPCRTNVIKLSGQPNLSARV